MKEIDMMNKECPCSKGVFKEMSIHDDWRGTLHCNVCNKLTNRYIPISFYREEQLNKVLKK
jgi:hypothetical protein